MGKSLKRHFRPFTDEKLISDTPIQINIPEQYYIKEDGSIKKIGCQSPSTFFPPRYTSSLASLIEALKVEGYWKNDGYGAICNSNKSLIDHIQRLLEDLGIHVTRGLIIKVKVDLNVEKSQVAVFKNGTAVKFHVQDTQIRNTRVKRIVFHVPCVSAEYMLKIGGAVHNLSVEIQDTHVKARCELPAFVYISLRFRSLTFSCLLKDALKEDGGKKSRTIRLNELLKRSPLDVIIAAFSMIVDCEGSVDYYRLFRRIRVRMTNKQYIEDWVNLLNSLGINSSLFKDELYGLCIQGNEDFRKLVNYGFNLHHSVKKAKFQKLLNSYKRLQVSRNTALHFYQEQLKRMGYPVTARELASVVGKSKRVVSHYLKKLSEKNMVSVKKDVVPYSYSFF